MDNPKIVKKCGKFGAALFAAATIFENEEIASFDGKCYSFDASDGDIPNDPPDYIRDHAIHFFPTMARDSVGLARYANHSCEPNCGIKSLFTIVAMRDIEPKEEITWDYAMTENDLWSFECRCGKPSCRGLIRGFRFLPVEKRFEYEGFISEFHYDPYIALRTHPELFTNFRRLPPGNDFTLQDSELA